jgi:hypothetical protein
MSNFTLVDSGCYTKQKIYKLCREGVCFYDEFREQLRNDTNLEPELGTLWPILKYVADGKTPLQSSNKYKKINKIFKYPVYEAKSPNLRMYVFFDQGSMVILLGDKKTEQEQNLNRIEAILKDYYEFKNQKT